MVGSRDATTVPTQALYLLNDPFVRYQSLNLAKRILARKDLDDRGADRSRSIPVNSWPRGKRGNKISRAVKYVSDYELAAGKELVLRQRRNKRLPVKLPWLSPVRSAWRRRSRANQLPPLFQKNRSRSIPMKLCITIRR